MLEDLEKLAGAVLDAGGISVVYIASPKQAAATGLRLLTDQTVWPCPALAAGTVVAVEPSAFVSAFGVEPRISASIETAIHFETKSSCRSVSRVHQTSLPRRRNRHFKKTW